MEFRFLWVMMVEMMVVVVMEMVEMMMLMVVMIIMMLLAKLRGLHSSENKVEHTSALGYPTTPFFLILLNTV